MIAQWMPFHLVAPRYMASIAKTFQSVFPNTVLWIDPVSKTGILLSSKDEAMDLGKSWPGLTRNAIARSLTDEQIRKGVLLDRAAMVRYGNNGEIIDDDNQLLAYGQASYQAGWVVRAGEIGLNDRNFALLKRVRKSESSQ